MASGSNGLGFHPFCSATWAAKCATSAGICRLGKEVYLFVYNGEPHGLTKRPNQEDYTIRLQQYFDHFLKGAPAPEWVQKGVPYIEKEKTALVELGAK